jgi:ribosome-associated translation inhibitor RaiA
MELHIESRNVTMTPRWEKEIAFRATSLTRGHSDLLHARVTLTKNRHHKKLDNVAEVLVVLTLPRRRTITARKQDKTFEEAIRSSFAAAEIEVKKFRDKRNSREVGIRHADV